MRVVNSADAGQLFRHYWPDLAAGELTVSDFSGGLSGTPLFQISSSSGTYALRGWWPDRSTQGERVAAVLQHVGRTLPGWVPGPIPPTRGGRSTLNLVREGVWAWNLEPWLPGAPDWEEQPSAARLESAAQKLALFHMATKECVPPLPVAFKDWENKTVSIQEQVGRLQRRIESGVYRNIVLPTTSDGGPSGGWPSDAPSVEVALQQGVRVVQNRLESCTKRDADRQICWGDAWHGNLLFTESEVTGLVDFVTMRIDSPLVDLARLIGSTCTGRPEWREVALASYGRVRPLSEGDRTTVAAFEAAGTVVSLGNWIYWLAVEQREFRHPAVARGRLAHFQTRMAELMEWEHPSRFDPRA